MSREDYREKFRKHVDAAPLPTFGDPEKAWDVRLTEPEINAIHSAMGFVRAACQTAPFPTYWGHYGATLEGLSDRLFKETEG